MISPPSLAGKWLPLTDRALFRLTGPDRVRYLNGQVTNDIAGPLDQESVAACLCNIKGRVEALVWVSADGDSLILDGEMKRREAIHTRLERYLIADDCEVTDGTEDIRLIHHFIEGSPGIRSLRMAEPGYDLLLKAGESHPFDADLMMTPEEIALSGLFAGIPEAGREINGDEFPAELGLDDLAVSFHKGCYLGQEIISRIESVGRIKRRLRLIQSQVPLLQDVLVENSRGEEGVTTRSTLPLGEKSHLGMALFRISPNGLELPRNEPVTTYPKASPNKL